MRVKPTTTSIKRHDHQKAFGPGMRRIVSAAFFVAAGALGTLALAGAVQNLTASPLWTIVPQSQVACGSSRSVHPEYVGPWLGAVALGSKESAEQEAHRIRAWALTNGHPRCRLRVTNSGEVLAHEDN